ncbi:MAG: phosphodiester glycosidase family protein [Solobacterium sp.]|nr:phosphodiester glycosidase family protein [Solobacterium sp.]
MIRQYLTGMMCGVLLTAYTGYVLMDTFVLRDTYTSEITDEGIADVFASLQDNMETDPSNDQQEASEGVQQSDTSAHKHRGSTKNESSVSDQEQDIISSGSPEITETSYSDENISITLTEYMEYDTAIYAADVTVSSAVYLKTAFADDAYGRNNSAATSEIAEAHEAVLAVNGDYYGARETGYVIRNGVVYRSVGDPGTDILCIYADGTMQIVDSSEASAEELVVEGVWQAFTFGPALIEDGEIAVSENDEVGKAKASNPRTAIGIIDANHYIFVVSDGRTDESEGLSLYQLAEFMKSLGVKCAYNLDGGGSSTMYFMGQVVNRPTTTGNSIKERSVSDIVYIG